MQCKYYVTLRRVNATLLQWESNSITHSECVSVALGIQHALHVHHTVIYGLAVTTMFTHCLINGTIFKKKVTEHKMCVLIFSTIFV